MSSTPRRLRPRSVTLLLPLVTALLVPTPLTGCGPSFYAAAPALIAGELPLSVKTLAELYDRTVTPAPSPEQAAATRADRTTAAEEAMKLPAAEARARLDALRAENRKTGWQPAIANLLWDLRDTLDSTTTGTSGPATAATAATAAPSTNPAAATDAPPAATSAASPELQAATARWITWRLGRVVANSVTTIQRPVTLNSGRLWKGEAEARDAARAQRDAEAIRELDTLCTAGMATAPPPLQPHWRVQAGAVWFRHWNFAKALGEFESVTRDFPTSPRAETAAFMAMRCRIELARDAVGEWHQRQDPEAANRSAEVTAAWDSYHQFAEKYSQGRFAADLPGWSGALRLIQGDWAMAFCDYIVQADVPDQPELTAGALREAERCLRLAAEHDGANPSFYGEGPARILAAHPRAAARFVYHLLEPSAAVNFGQWPWTSESNTAEGIVEFRRSARWQIRETLRSMLPALARELERKAAAVEKGPWDPFALAVIAWTACEDGDYERVLALCRHYPDTFRRGDDLQMVRAISLQRMGRPAEAVRAWNNLAADFPQSPLRAQAERRIVSCLIEAGDPASALALLPPPPDRNAPAATIPSPEELGNASQPADQELNPAASPDKSPLVPAKPAATASGDQPSPLSSKTPDEMLIDAELREASNGSLSGQWRDVLSLAAPLESLQQLFLSGQRAGNAAWFGPVIASRLAGRGEFILAREFLLGPDLPIPQDRYAWWYGPDSRPGPSHLPGAAEWETAFAAAAKSLQTAREAAHGEAAAQAWLEAGNGIHELRNQWSFSCPTGGYMNSESRQWEVRTRRNARTLGYSADAVTDGILHQDPLTLASECWAKAVDAAPNSPAAARALFLQNEALRLRAEYSPFAAAVADERDWTAESAKLVASLQALRRVLPEAADLADSAVPWQFQDMPWLPGNIHQSYADEALLTALIPAGETEIAASAPAVPQIAALTRTAWRQGGTAAALRKLEELRTFCCSSRMDNLDTERLPALRLIGDLRAAMGVPDLTSSQRESCLDWISGASLDSLRLIAGWEDLVTYSELRAREFARYSPEQPAAWQLWISENHRSVRLEDASFQFLRAECRRYRGWTRFSNTSWPKGPQTNSRYLMITVDRQVPASPESAEAAKTLLNAFQHRWPNSKYEADVALLRCGSAIDRKKWQAALDLILPIVENHDHRELHMEAVHLTADIFLHLLDPEDRAALADAIRARPAALKILARFMTSNTPGGRLLPLRDWLGLSSVRVPPPPAENSEG